MFAHVANRDVGRQVILDELPRRRRHHRLTAMSDGPETSRPVHRRSVVVTQLQIGRTGVQRDPDPDGPGRRPFDPGQTSLDVGGSSHCIDGRNEDDEPAVALTPGFDGNPPVAERHIVDHCVVSPQRLHHEVGRFLPQRGAPLYVGEEKGDQALRKICHGQRSYFSAVDHGLIRATSITRSHEPIPWFILSRDEVNLVGSASWGIVPQRLRRPCCSVWAGPACRISSPTREPTRHR